mmetsp:Transcript_24949/g.33419  ORF Transcript_24949/g.33419 Transcript_24949/m.33419 type:complete len:101 (-) Transcript_24949:878-1180(-)|eukprot:CAMPEP_0185599152 /NCGR_PEP_ID=MMETSP0434-20130131/82496_1 /TAXON_ID=626734 ORGANISM="Favella taraikaensis, Strain Fe Narragansett Bay" /NCGR_SAMPLE_ID=MMETSP0434 /ASSEMBLY_ACC=CAM_ASM_000379 /LENGTH=100 /DNA_ID=CAMNT_0028228423 /DNA_START=1002 /DNA_END=1304 /DNA_ORIENTATION=-
MVAKHAKVATKLAQRKDEQQGNDEVDELEINPANAAFLKGIDLGDSSEDEVVEEENFVDEDEAKWSQAYVAVNTLENLFSSCQGGQVIAAFSEELGRDVV